MAKITVRHACGHTERVEVGDGTARDKSSRAFDAALNDCQSCIIIKKIAEKEPAIAALFTDNDDEW